MAVMKSAPFFSKRSNETNEAIRSLYSTDIFQGIELAELGLALSGVQTEIYQAGTLLFTPDESSERLYILRKGRVDLYRLTRSGRRLVTRRIQPGSVFGMMVLLGQTVQGNFAVTAEDSEIWVITREDILALLKKRPDVALRILEIVGNRLRLLEERLVETVYSSVQSRLVRFLLSNADTSSGLLLNFTHEEIGDNIGAVRQTVSELLGNLRRRGLIVTKPRQIQIVDRRGLEKTIRA